MQCLYDIVKAEDNIVSLCTQIPTPSLSSIFLILWRRDKGEGEKKQRQTRELLNYCNVLRGISFIVDDVGRLQIMKHGSSSQFTYYKFFVFLRWNMWYLQKKIKNYVMKHFTFLLLDFYISPNLPRFAPPLLHLLMAKWLLCHFS